MRSSTDTGYSEVRDGRNGRLRRAARFVVTYSRDLWNNVSSGVIALATIGSFALSIALIAIGTSTAPLARAAVVVFVAVAILVVCRSLVQGARYQYDVRSVEESIHWRILDEGARECEISASRTVVAMNDRVSVLTDSYRGDGIVNAEYKCDIGTYVGDFQSDDSPETTVVIGLRKQLRRGEEVAYSSERLAKGHFPDQAIDEVGVAVKESFKRVDLSVEFPRAIIPVEYGAKVNNEPHGAKLRMSDRDGGTGILEFSVIRPKRASTCVIWWKWPSGFREGSEQAIDVESVAGKQQ